MSIPDRVAELGDGCFYECESLRSVTFGPDSSLARIGQEAFAGTAIESLSIPDTSVKKHSQVQLLNR